MDTAIDISCRAMSEDRELDAMLDEIESQFCKCIHAEEGQEATDEDEARVHALTKVLLEQYQYGDEPGS